MWFYSRGSERIGPIPLEELVVEMTSGRVKDHDLLWQEGMESWTPASEVIEVQRAVADARFQQAMPGARSPQAVQMTMATSPMALTSMVLGIVSVVMGTLALTGIAAVICGHIARRQIRESSQPMGGDGMAIAGLILGYMSIIFTVALIGFFIFAFHMASQASGVGFP